MQTTGITQTTPTLVSGLVSSSIGKKWFVAVTGALLLLFVTGHMIGNLQIFIGQDQLNNYAAKLQALGPILWVIRTGMIALTVLHIVFAVKLKLENWQARPQRYAFNNTVQASWGSRTMIWSGLLIFAFVTYHLMHFTFLNLHPEYHNLRAMLHGQQVHDVYSMVIVGFQQPVISIFYIIMMALLALHISHGAKSMFQTLGWNNERYEPKLNRFAIGLAIFLFLGYISIPISILLGWVKLPAGVTI